MVASLRRKGEHGRALESLAGPKDRGRKTWLVDRVRVMLGFQTKPAVLHVIAGVELNTRLRRSHFQHAATDGIVHAGCQRQRITSRGVTEKAPSAWVCMAHSATIWLPPCGNATCALIAAVSPSRTAPDLAGPNASTAHGAASYSISPQRRSRTCRRSVIFHQQTDRAAD